MKGVILELVKRAIDQLTQTRAQEGQMLLTEMTENCELMKKSLSSIRKRSPIVVKEYHSKLEKRIKELSAEAQLEIDADLLAREAVIFADRCDIAEELARLDSHLQQFVMHSKDGQNAGRRLDFISQEMLREANTIASKASDAKISQQVIDIKCAIDRIKEQVQNVE